MTGSTDDLRPAALDRAAGTVVYRHIPHDWNIFYVKPHTQRRRRLCPTRGPSKLEGIPGVTPQPLSIDGRPGWCKVCIQELFNWYKNEYQNIVTIPEANAAYNIVFFEMFRFMRHVVENDL